MIFDQSLILYNIATIEKNLNFDFAIKIPLLIYSTIILDIRIYHGLYLK